MQTIKFITIQPTEETITIQSDVREQLSDLFGDVITNVETAATDDPKKVVETVCGILGTESTVNLTMVGIHESIDTLFVAYFIDRIDSPGSNQVNKLASQIASHGTKVEVVGPLCICKHTLTHTVQKNNIRTVMRPTTLDRYEAISMLESFFTHQGIIINADDTMAEYQFFTNPMERLLAAGASRGRYIYHEYEVFTHVIQIIVDTETDQPINNFATLLSGRPCFGRVYIGMYRKPTSIGDPPYINLTVERIQKIINIRRKSPAATTGLNQSVNEYICFDKLLQLTETRHCDAPDVVIDMSLPSLNSGAAPPNPDISTGDIAASDIPTNDIPTK